MKSLFWNRFVLALAAAGAGSLSWCLDAADVGITGTINQVPGYPAGTKLDYTVGATKTAPKTASFWIYLKNNNDFDIKVVICSMLSLKNKPNMNLGRYEVAKNGGGQWECYPRLMSFGPPNYHHSCVNVTVPAHGIANPFDTKDVFSVDFEKADLGSVYFDVLKDCPLKNCAQVVGPDKFLVPLNPLGHADWVNIWAHSSGTGPSPLGPGGFTSWPSGNWVTMGYQSRYPARLVGTLLDAPVGSIVRFNFNGQGGGSYDVPPCPTCPPGTNTLVRISERFVIPDNIAAEDEMHIDISPESLRRIPEGAVMRFQGDVLAEPGAEFYQPGEFMYGIDMTFVNDTRPPIILTQSVQQVYAVLRVAVTATDEATMASGASFVWRDPAGVEQERGMNFATPAAAGNLMFFADEFADLPTGVPIRYYFNVYDNLGNVASTRPATIVLRPLLNRFNDCLTPPGTSFPGAGNVGHVADDGTGRNCVVHLTDINQGSAYGVFHIPTPILSGRGDNLHLHWRSLIGGDNGSVCGARQFDRPGADGYSVSWGADLPNPPSYGNPGEEGAGAGLIVTVDTYDNGNGEAPGLEIKWRGNRVAFDNINPDPGLAKDFLRKGVFVEADLTVDPAGQVTFAYDGRVLTAALPDWTGLPGAGIMFGARTGGACDNHWIDDLLIENYCPVPPGTSFPGLGNVAHMADDGTGENCVVHLTDVNQGGAFGAWLVRDPLPQGRGDSLHMRWRSLIGGDGGLVCGVTQFDRPGADGYSMNWASDLPNPPSYGNPGEEGAGTGLTVTVDTFDNGNGEAPTLEIKWRGNRVALDNIHPNPGLAKDFLRKGVFVDADLTVDAGGHATFTYDGRVLTATLPGWNGPPDGSVLFGARTGGACDNHWIDDLRIESSRAQPPVIVQQPQGQSLPCGGTATFSVTATGTAPLAYQWQHDGVDLPGATQATLSISPVQPGDAGSYNVRVSNSGGSSTSTAASLVVLPGPVPRLRIMWVGPNVLIHWPVTCGDYDLQEMPTLGVGTPWTPTTASVALQGTEYRATTAIDRGGNRFFRLAQRQPGAIPQQPPEIPLFEYTEFDPTPIGATDIQSVPWQEIPGSLTDELERQIRLAAQQDPQVRSQLGDRFAYITTATTETPKGSDHDPAEPLRTQVTFFSHSFNTTVLADMRGTTVVGVTNNPTLQPPEGADEEIAAVALARRDPRLSERVQRLVGRGLLVVIEAAGTPGFGDRVIYVSFADPTEAAPRFAALVDLTRQEVVSVLTP